MNKFIYFFSQTFLFLKSIRKHTISLLKIHTCMYFSTIPQPFLIQQTFTWKFEMKITKLASKHTAAVKYGLLNSVATHNIKWCWVKGKSYRPKGYKGSFSYINNRTYNFDTGVVKQLCDELGDESKLLCWEYSVKGEFGFQFTCVEL